MKKERIKIQKEAAIKCAEIIDMKLKQKTEKPQQILSRLLSYVSFKTEKENHEEVLEIRQEGYKMIDNQPFKCNAILIKIYQLDTLIGEKGEKLAGVKFKNYI